MPQYRYKGAEPVRYGSALIKPGDVVELPAPANKHFELVGSLPRAATPPDAEAKPVKPQRKKEND